MTTSFYQSPQKNQRSPQSLNKNKSANKSGTKEPSIVMERSSKRSSIDMMAHKADSKGPSVNRATPTITTNGEVVVVPDLVVQIGGETKKGSMSIIDEETLASRAVKSIDKASMLAQRLPQGQGYRGDDFEQHTRLTMGDSIVAAGTTQK